MTVETQRTVIYLVGREDGPVKVGITARFRGRLAMLQTGCHFKLEVFGVWPLEMREKAQEHERAFKGVYDCRRASGEWFDMSADEAIEGIQNSLQIEEAFRQRELRCLMSKTESERLAAIRHWQWQRDVNEARP